jgi:hypothetical protein
MRSREAFSIAAFAVVLVLGCVAAALAPFIKESYEKPDPAKMRAYRMSLLTDAQVLELHARAVREVDRRREQKIEAEKVSNAEQERKWRECEANPVAKLRDPQHCTIPEHFSDPGFDESVEQVFEDYVMDFCEMVGSVREAKEHKCLP